MTTAPTAPTPLKSDNATHHVSLTGQERSAELDVDALSRLVGLVDHDPSDDPFPVVAMDAVVFVCGNATQTAHYFQSAWGMQLVAYTGPEVGNRDHVAFVLTSGSARFVIEGGVAPSSPHLDVHRAHGDAVVDLALEVADVDRCIAHARAQGAEVLVEPHDERDEHGSRADRRHRHLRTRSTHPGRPESLHGAVSARIRRPTHHPGPPARCAETAVPGA